jgi:GT2 family glycosyltransferase
LPSVSVIVPIFNGTSYMPLFFESLAAALPEGAQLILVDDGSTEPVWDTVPEFPRAGSVERLANDTNLGYSVAVNRGFEIATGDVIVQLNTDLVLQPNCISAMVDLVGRERDVGVVGSKLIYPTTNRVQHVGMALGNVTKRRIFYGLPPDHPLCCRTRQLQIVSGATVAMSRRALGTIGPLDEAYFNRNEDIEHCLRAIKHGLRNFICAESVAHHWRSQSGPARFARILEGDSLFWARWGDTCAPDLDRFVDEGFDHVLQRFPQVEELPFEILDLSRNADQAIVLECLAKRWPGVEDRRRDYRQMNNGSTSLWLPLLVPHRLAEERAPFVYLVDSHLELEENALWFETRERFVEDELIVDSTGAAMHTSELRCG